MFVSKLLSNCGSVSDMYLAHTSRVGKRCSMLRGFIQRLAHNALYFLRFCLDVQQIPPQT